MKAYINKVASAPDWASLPLQKLICYSGEDRNNRVFAQAQLALSNEFLFLRMLAFESAPDTTSELSAVLLLEREPQRLLYVSIRPDMADCRAEVRLESGAAPIRAELHPMVSEDLQGIYWGSEAKISLSDIGGSEVFSGGSVRGNLFKEQQAEGETPGHFGALFNAPPHDFFDIESLGELIIVEY